MSLRQTVESDLSTILGDTVSGFGWPIKLTSPDGLSVDMVGFSTDIGLAVDPDTGQVVSGRTASVGLMMSAIRAAGFPSMPLGVDDEDLKPWIVDFNDIGGTAFRFKVSRDIPDNAAGIIIAILEAYQ